MVSLLENEPPSALPDEETPIFFRHMQTQMNMLSFNFEALPDHPFPVFTAVVTAEEWLAFAYHIKDKKRRFVALWGEAAFEAKGGKARDFWVYAAFDLKEGLLVLSLKVSADTPFFPDLSEIFPAANRMQRALFDLLGLAASRKEGAADTRPWLRHANWPEHHHPLQAGTKDEDFPAHHEEYAFVPVLGDGVHEIPVGPIHAGIIEPGQFRFSVVGERVLRLEERLGWKHKGIERRFVGMRLEEGAKLAGRVSGDSTVAYALAYAHAAEAICATKVPPRGQAIRALLLERERILNHLGDLGYLGNDVALSFGLMQFMRLKEEAMRLNDALFGHRLMMDAIIPGGVLCDVDEKGALLLLEQSQWLASEVKTLKNIYDEHAGVQDRFRGTGVLLPETACQLSVTGLPARASGQEGDLRVHHPFAPYDRLAPKTQTEATGDVSARVSLRFFEIFESLRQIQTLLVNLPTSPLFAKVGKPKHAKGFGWVEGWRGDILVALSVKDGAISRAHLHDPSWQNWPALEHAIIDNIVPDFPLINKSFNLSYAGQDL